MLFAKIFSHSVGCLLVLLIVSFAVQKLFILMRHKQFIFAFVSLASRDMLSKKLLQPRSKRFLLAFSSRILMASCLTFRSYFEFIFVYGEESGPGSFFCMSLSSFLSTTCWRDCLYSIGYSFLLCQRLVGHMFVGPFLGSVFCSIDLSVCFVPHMCIFLK